MTEEIRNGFVAGAWDLLHSGHAHFLAQCGARCDRLFVGLHVDPSVERREKNRPIQTVYERYIQLAYHKSVYHILPYQTEQDLKNILATLDVHVRFLGSDYEVLDLPITAEQYCKDKGIEIVFIPRDHDWSSNGLRERINNG